MSDAQVLPGEAWDSPKRTGWRDTARVALEKAGVSNTLLDRFDQADGLAFTNETTDEEFRRMVNSNLSQMIAVVESAVNALGWELEGEQDHQTAVVEEPWDEDLPPQQEFPEGPVKSIVSTFDVGDANFLHVNGEVWRDTAVDDEGPLRKGGFFGESLPKVSQLSFQDLAGYFDEITVSLPGVAKDLRDWEFAYAEVELYGKADEPLGVAFRIEYDLEFWVKQYSLSDLATAVEQVLERSGAPFKYWQRNENTCLNGFGVSCSMNWGATVGDAIAKEADLQQLAFAVKQHLQQRESRSLNLVFAFPAPIKSACEQYLLYFVQFLSDLGIEAKAEIKEQASKVLFSVSPVDEKEALGKIYEALQVYLGLPRTPDLAMVADQGIAVVQLRANVLHLQSQLMLAKAVMEMKNATLDAKDSEIALLQDRIDLREFQPKTESKPADKEELVKGLVSVKKYDFKFFEFNVPEMLRKLKRRF